MATAEDRTRQQLRRCKEMSKFEKTQLIAHRDEELQAGAEPLYDVGNVHDTNVVATQEFYLGLLDEYRVRRFFTFGEGKRLKKDFRVGDMREMELLSTPLMRTAYSAHLDIHGNPLRLCYLSEAEIDAVVGVVMDQQPLPGGPLPVKGNEACFITEIRAHFECVRTELRDAIRVIIREEIRLTLFPNSVHDLFRLACFIGKSYNLTRAAPNQLVGNKLNDVVVDSQGVISSFHAIGRRVSALASQQAADQLIKGYFKVHGDHLVFDGPMNPFLAIVHDRRHSELRFNDVLRETMVMDVGQTDTKALHAYFLRGEDVLPRFVRIHMKTKLLCWHEVLVSTVALSVERAAPQCISVPHTQHQGIIDVFFRPRQAEGTTAQIVHGFLQLTLPKMRFPLKPNAIKGVSVYTGQSSATTAHVLQEIFRTKTGDRNEYLWHIDAQELRISCPGDPLRSMLEEIDPDVVYEALDTGVASQPLSRQRRVVISEARMQAAKEKIEALRVVALEQHLRINQLMAHPDDEETVQARVQGRQVEVKLAPLAIITAYGEEEVLRQTLGFEAQARALLRRDISQKKTRAALFRAMNPPPADTSTFAAHYRQTVILTDGTNLIDNIQTLPGVDATRSYTINPADTYTHLGCEAMRQHLLRVLVSSFSKKSKKADPALLCLISQIMTSKGVLTRLSDLDVLECGESVLRSATRSRGMMEFSNAALKGSVSKVPGVLTSQVMGQPVAAGTGSAMILPPPAP